MSIGELGIILIIALLVIKPDDIPIIIAKIIELRKALNDFVQSFTSQFNLEKNSIAENDIERINFYLQKITDLGINYEGEYSLKEIKRNYNKIVKQKITEANDADKNVD
jgi:Sec-independent protein translocase protein TatA